MVAEGVFPKSAGDIAYASEANRFQPKMIGFGQQATQSNSIGSTTAYQVIGTPILYYGASGISSYMKMETYAGTYDGTNLSIAFNISGPGLNNMTMSNASFGGAGIDVHLDHILTSGALTASGGNVGSNYSINVKMKADTGGVIRYGNLTVIGW